MTRDPYEILGIARDATLAEAKAAYRRVAELFHPDRLQGLRAEVQAEGEQRLREVNDAFRAVRNRLARPLVAPGHEKAPPARGRPPATRGRPGTLARRQRVFEGRKTWQPSDAATAATAGTYDAQLRTISGGELHVRWKGRHAEATLTALRRGHRIDGLIHQLEWGCYEVELDGAATRRLLSSVLTDDDWRDELVEVLRGESRRSCLALGELVGLLDDDGRYSVVVDAF